MKFRNLVTLSSNFSKDRPQSTFSGGGSDGANAFFVAIDAAEFFIFTAVLKQILHQKSK